eukprot:scaffold71622_cov20-Tisochrysis_lutea.AAC.1
MHISPSSLRAHTYAHMHTLTRRAARAHMLTRPRTCSMCCCSCGGRIARPVPKLRQKQKHAPG